MSRIDEGRLLARGLYQEDRIRLFFPREKDTQSVRTVIRALNTIDEAIRKPAHSVAHGLLLAILGISIAVTELLLKGTVRTTPLVVSVLFILSPVIIYKLRAREARNHALPKAVNDLNALFTSDPSLVDILARIKSLELEPYLLTRVAPYVPQLSNKGG
jgi:hypothetical protein